MDLPAVSIIIPVLNQKDNLKRCLDSIFEQDYPREKMEVIVVDNGSTDGSWELLGSYDLKRLRVETEKNPYIARNLGITNASHEFLVLSDSRIIPKSKKWIEKGFEGISRRSTTVNYGLVDGYKYSKSFTNKSESYEFARFNYFAFKSISCLITNIFVHKEIFKKVGFFSENTRSGADMIWVTKVINMNIKIRLSTEASVYYITKGFSSYYKKNIRIGKGKLLIYKNTDASRFFYIIGNLWYMKPPNPIFMFKVLKLSSPSKYPLLHIIEIYFVVWFFNIIRGLAALGLLKNGD